eukprot:Lithocolla_globosa_v1_NODE_137_length_5828_cov_7.342228.p4 type:complete len:102 gc:universal NODE_137_length_5828_cov_7.342228:4990-4685(-)
MGRPTRVHESNLCVPQVTLRKIQQLTNPKLSTNIAQSEKPPRQHWVLRRHHGRGDRVTTTIFPRLVGHMGRFSSLKPPPKCVEARLFQTVLGAINNGYGMS